VNEVPRIAKWLYGLLGPVAVTHGLTHTVSGSTVARVSEDMAPAGWASPYILFGFQSPGNDVDTLTGRVWATPLYQVKVVGQTSKWEILQPIADAIGVRLDKARGTVDGYRIESNRVRLLKVSEFPNNVEWRHLGGLFRIKI
jgi:hypothetical protein